jgi:hypothetical protein
LGDRSFQRDARVDGLVDKLDGVVDCGHIAEVAAAETQRGDFDAGAS